jgi:hypothetical protein
MLVEICADGETIGEALATLDRLVSEMGLLAEGIPEHGVNAEGRDVVNVLTQRPRAAN